MFSNAVSNENFAFLEGVTGAHHSISHHQNDPDKLRQYQLINRWHVEQYAYLLRKLQGDEGSRWQRAGPLDDSARRGMRDGNNHDPHNLPVVMADAQAAGSTPDSTSSAIRILPCPIYG